MKITGTTKDKMQAAFHAVVKHHGIDRIKQSQAERGLSRIAVIWELWFAALDNLSYRDSHPKFVAGFPRTSPYDPDFQMPDVNDNHIETAIKQFAKECGL